MIGSHFSSDEYRGRSLIVALSSRSELEFVAKTFGIHHKSQSQTNRSAKSTPPDDNRVLPRQTVARPFHKWVEHPNVYCPRQMNSQVNEAEDNVVHSRRIDILGNNYADHDKDDDVREIGRQFPELVHEVSHLGAYALGPNTRHEDAQGHQPQNSGNMKEMLADEENGIGRD